MISFLWDIRGLLIELLLFGGVYWFFKYWDEMRPYRPKQVIRREARRAKADIDRIFDDGHQELLDAWRRHRS
jgi:hypothetical protein